MIIAHRGARAFAPENTLPAFAKAARLGAAMVEFDVQLTSDGEPVVVHDDTLDRCSNVRAVFPHRQDLHVRAFTLSEIRQLDAGSWFVRELELEPVRRQPFLQSLHVTELQQFISESDRAEYASGLVRHPTLLETLALCRDLELEMNIELKAPDRSASETQFAGPTVTVQSPAVSAGPSVPDRLVQRVIGLVDEMCLANRVLVSSFDHSSLRKVKRLNPKIRTGVLAAQPIENAAEYCRALDAYAYHPGCLPGWDAVGFNSEVYARTQKLPAEPFRSLRASGIEINVWTENNPTRMRQLLDAGATGIFTDYLNRGVGI